MNFIPVRNKYFGFSNLISPSGFFWFTGREAPCSCVPDVSKYTFQNLKNKNNKKNEEVIISNSGKNVVST